MKHQGEKSIKVVEEIVQDIMDAYNEKLLKLNRRTYSWNLQYKDDVFSINMDVPDYWWFGENGRKAGKMPPIESVLKWIRIKRIIPRPLNGELPTQEQLAFLIARKIGRYGVVGKHPWKHTLEEAQQSGKLDELQGMIFNFIVSTLEEELEKIDEK